MTVAAQMKAEMILSLQLSLRHRAVRLAGVLAIVALGMGRESASSLSGLLLIGGVLAATAASRPLAPGPAFHLARRAAGAPVLTVLGRFCGVALMILAAVTVAAAVLAGNGAGPALWREAAVAFIATLAIAAPVLALAPLVGASGAAGLGLLAILFGQFRPSTVALMLERWPLVRDAAVLLWNTTPLSWRADRWAATGHAADPLVFGLWIVLGVAVGVWALLPPRDHQGTIQ